MALKRYIHSVALAEDGVRDDVDSWVAGTGKMKTLANVEIDRDGRVGRRWGVEAFTGTVMTPPSPLTGSVNYSLRIGSVNSELVTYTGKAIYGYSPAHSKWVHRGEWGSMKTELVAAVRDVGGKIRCGDVCVKNGYVVAGYAATDASGSATEPFVLISGETSGEVTEPELRISTATDCGNGGLRMLACGTVTVGMLWAETGNVLKYTYADTSSWASWTTVNLSTARLSTFDAVSMGASGFVYAFYENGTGNIRVTTADTTGTQIQTATFAFTGTVYGIGIHWDGASIHLVYHSAGNLVYRRYSAALALQGSGTVATLTTAYPRCAVVYNSASTRALVVWHETSTSAAVTTHTTTLIKYREVDSTGAVYGTASKTHAHYLISRPVCENGQYHFVVSSDLHTNPAVAGYPALRDPDGDGTNQRPGYSYDGLFMMRMEPLLLTEAQAAPIPVSAFALGEGFGADNVYQFCPQDLAASADTGAYYSFMGTAIANFQGDAATRQGNVYKHTRDPVGAGKVLPIGSGALVLGGVPSFYDGRSAYNLATLVRPVILELEKITGGGSLTVNGVYGVMLVEEWLDEKGNVVLSQASDAVTCDLGATDNRIGVKWRASTIENKRDGYPVLSALYNQRRMSFYRTESGGTTYYYEKSVYINKFATDWNITSLTSADTELRDDAQPYTVGGELSNNPLPSGHVGCISNGRAHVRSDERKNRVYYSKPLVPTRSVEFDLLQSYNTFPEDIVGMADMGGFPLAVSAGHVYVVEGLGPGLAGLPANAFSVREVAAVGTSDQESVLAVPGGVLFRGPDSFYLVTGGGIEPVGDKIQDTANTYGTTLAADLDPTTRSARFLVTSGTATRVLVYYWDRKQWVVHDPVMETDTTTTALTAHAGAMYYADTAGNYGVANGDSYTDAGRAFYQTIGGSWESLGQLQGRKRWYEVNFLVRRKAACGLKVELWYGRKEDNDADDKDTFYFDQSALTTMGELAKVRVQIPHGRGVTDAIRWQLSDILGTYSGSPSTLVTTPATTQAFQLVAVDYVVGLTSEAVKLTAARTA